MRPLRGLRQILFPKIFEISDCFGTFPKMTENAQGGCQKQGLLVSTRASSTNVSKPENPQKKKKTWGLVYGHISHSSEKFCCFVFLLFLLFLLFFFVFFFFCFFFVFCFCFFFFCFVVFFCVFFVFLLFFCFLVFDNKKIGKD